MNGLYLPGNNPSNKEWIKELEQRTAEGLFDDTVVANWKHWENGGQMIDLEAEVGRINSDTKDMSGPFAIIAKSVGHLVALELIEREIISPETMVIIGSFFNEHTRNEFDIPARMAGFSIPTRYIQAEKDPALYADELRSFLGLQTADGTLVEIPGDDHDYPDIAKVAELTREHLVK